MSKSTVLLSSILIAALMLGGCATTLKSIAKSDIDMVGEAHYQFTQSLLKELTLKLYQRNPVQLKRSPNQTVERRVEQLFSTAKLQEFAEIDNKQGIAAIELAFASAFAGDRVFALMAGLSGMINQSYGYRSEFYIFGQSLNEAQLYKSARNIEVLMWMLAKRVDAKGKPLIITNSLLATAPVNISYERLLGKLIATQDMMAVIAAQKNQRLLNTIVHNVASMSFIPL